jgi:RNA polymerase sigma-70 factor (ECF subfamily)
MKPLPPEAMVAALAAGQPEAYAALYDRLAPALLRVARAMLCDAAAAEDAVQDLFVNLVQARERMAFVEDLDAYVFAVLRNVAARRLRSRQMEQTHLRRLAMTGGGQPSPARAADEELDAALASLPPEQREVVVLKISGGLTFAQIGAIVRVSPNTVAGRYRYAMEKLRKALEKPS